MDGVPPEESSNGPAADESQLLRFDAAAQAKLREMHAAGRFEAAAVRVRVEEEGASFLYELEVVDSATREAADAVLRCDEVTFYVDALSQPRLRGATLEYVDAIEGGGFRFDNPNRPRLLDDPLAARIQQLIDERINPGVSGHGGRVSLVDVQAGGRVLVRLGGGCQGCGMAAVTLREGVTKALMQEFGEITEVVDVTDHAAGETPYYSS